jgi:hypothetical protein
MAQLLEVLQKGATAHGYPTDEWLLERVARVVEDQTGIRYPYDEVIVICEAMGATAHNKVNEARPSRREDKRRNRADHRG